MKHTLKLYALQRDAGIKIFEECSDGSKWIEFKHIDGAYSLCITEKGNPIHLSAMTPLVEVEGGYKISVDEEK